MTRYRIVISGIVQGVGFRPFVFNLASRMKLKGWVGNADSDVIIEIEAEKDDIFDFINQLKDKAPVLSRIESLKAEELPLTGYSGFSIKKSESISRGNIFISPDVAACEDCLNELRNRQDRRYGYPFINCTNCGPRFTIIKDIPYDRDKTTMSCFEMCSSCRREYTDPTDRRYHAQPVSCHDCGPSLGISDEKGGLITAARFPSEKFSPAGLSSKQCTDYIGEVLKAGKIAAIKGIGGYHLACDALNEEAVNRLRSRKHRDDKPFALMMKNLATAEKYCYISAEEKKLLKSPASPIVLLEKKQDLWLPAAIASFNRTLGIMLPYTPIHHILFGLEGFPEALVMTSGNLSSEPIFYKDCEAIAGLTGIADAFLTNNRDIYMRTDDSVTRVFNEKEYIIRRSRGYVPEPVRLDAQKLLGIGPEQELPSILACGGELKNVFCLNKGNLFYLSHHIGDLENESTFKAFENAIEHFKKLFGITPEHVAYDLHPGYFSSQYAHKLNKSGTPVQHHKAHIASCMAENGLSGQVIGVSLDGSGYGEDGNIWGGEFFKGGYYGFDRAGHLEYIMMPGGDSAVKHPWKMALGALHSAGMLNLAEGMQESSLENVGLLTDVNQQDIDFTVKMLERRLNCPLTSSMGRLFDAVSALIGIKTHISYEGQAAIELEYYAEETDNLEPYPMEIACPETLFIVKTSCIIEQIVKDITEGKSREHISSRFHLAMAHAVLRGCMEIRGNGGGDRVVLSGGVFQNITLLRLCIILLENNNFTVYTHSRIPANDGGIALGQAMMALAECVSRS